ncbi:prepilin-type N-terminal cleavage/methylation domain-containing protein [Viridibacillus sp. FSL E2-0187]|uniref:type IV pilus modification PilV family protein n=1 Tax=Viridibacillus sp. FSL E2-0187 TaxID=2921362 RepID=UPI0030F55484
MMKFYKQIRSNEKGFTLIEVLASFVILVILLTSFFTFFIQTAKTGKNSENIVDATYIAQSEMEKAYAVSKKESNREEAIKSLGYTLEGNGSEFIKTEATNTIKLKLKNNTNAPNLTNIIITVYENKEITPKAQMENVFVWK